MPFLVDGDGFFELCEGIILAKEGGHLFLFFLLVMVIDGFDSGMDGYFFISFGVSLRQLIALRRWFLSYFYFFYLVLCIMNGLVFLVQDLE